MTIELKPTYGSPRWSGELCDCSMPMTFDQYGKCGFDCIYCFARYQKDIGLAKENFRAESLTHVPIEKVKKIFTGETDSQFWPLIKEKKIMQWGGLADPFCLFEKDNGIGLELLKFFKEIDYPLSFSTKGTWWLEDKRYTDLFKGQKNWHVKMSIITLDTKLASIIERKVPTPRKRLEAISKLKKLKIGGITLRLRPFIIGVSDPHHKKLIASAAKNGADSLSTEFFCLETRSATLREELHKISLMVGFDILAFYKKYSVSAGYLRLNRNIKRRFVDEMQEACSTAGIRFFVSDAHFKERCDGGSCCGLPNDWNFCKGQWTELLQLAKERPNHKVYWKDVSKHLAHFKKFLYRRAAGLNTKGSLNRAKYHDHTLYEWVRNVWNNPKNGQNPYKMYEGILKPVGKDKNNNLVYQYDKERE